MGAPRNHIDAGLPAGPITDDAPRARIDLLCYGICMGVLLGCSLIAMGVLA